MPAAQLIAVDLDGTLLRSDGTLSQRTCAALTLAQSAGTRIIVVTARPPRFLTPVTVLTGLSGMAVCSNGAIVYDLDTRVHEVTGPLSVELAQHVVTVISEILPEAGFAVETGSRTLCEPAYQHVSRGDGGRQAVGSRAEIWAAEAIAKLLVWSPATGVAQARELIREALPGVECTYSGGSGLLEISAGGVTKSGTLAALCARWGVSAAEVVAFGDMPNDLDMLVWAGAGYAMGNADPLVLQAIPRRTGTNDEDGVAMVLEEMFAAGSVGPLR